MGTVSSFLSCTCTPFFSFLSLAHSLARFFLFTLLHFHILLLAALACTLPFLFTHFHFHTSATFCTAAGEGIFCGLGSYSAEAVGQFPIFFLSVVTTIVYMGF